MRLCSPLSISIIVFVMLVPFSISRIQPAQAQVGCYPIGCLLFPNYWSPYGPFVQNLRFQYYSYDFAEFSAFEAGHLDVVDFQIPRQKFSSYDLNPDFVLSPPQGTFSIYGIYFNGAASTWKAWGCDWNTGTPFTASEQTYSSQCGIDMRQAFMHLVDRPAFTRNGQAGTAQAIADPSPPAKDPSASSLSTQCSWDKLFPSPSYTNCLGAYNFADDPSGFATLGSPDFCAAADHMIAAGIGTGKDPTSCVLTGINSGPSTHPIRFFIHRSDSRRVSLGSGFMNALNQLFGSVVIRPNFGTIAQFGPIVFEEFPCPGPGILCMPGIDDWDAYTYGYTLGGPYPDHLFDLFYRQHASDYCGGPQNTEPHNPTFVCLAQLDQDMLAASQTSDINMFHSNTLAAFNLYGSHAVDMPVFSPAIRTVALTSVAGLVNAVGLGYSNFWTMLNGHKDPNYTPVNPIYAFGGGDSTTLRWGQASTTFLLNIFNAQTAWDFQAIGEVYDTLFLSSPVQPGNIMCWMCNTYSYSTDSNGNAHYTVELRQSLRWQDGVPIDSKDVKFSLLNFRDHGQTLGGQVSLLKSVTILNPSMVDIVFNGQSISFLLALESFIIPRHLWELAGDNTYGDVGTVDPAKLDPNYDPIASGTFIGSGPFMCRSVFPEDLGRIGTGCVSNPDGSRGGQSTLPGGILQLQAFDRTSEPGNTDPFLQYMRSYNPSWGKGSGTAAQSGQFQEFSWADQNNDAQVNITDLVSVGACWHASQPTAQCPASQYNYWLKPAFHPDSPNTISSEVAIVAAHMDDTYVFPYSWNPPNLENITPFTP